MKRLRVLLSVMICCMLVLTGCAQEQTATITDEAKQTEAAKTSTKSTTNTSKKATLKVHFIDVGQGDSILLQCKGKNMLIDAGDNQYGQTVVNYLKKQGVKKIDYLIGTHPDADHIGGLDNVIRSFSIGKIYMPKVQKNTKTYEDVLLAIKEKKLKITSPKANDTFMLGDAKAIILAPIKTYEDANNNSIVIRVTHGKKAFIFQGDAELDEEVDILNSKANLKADVIKIGHHGSHSSSSKKYMQAVNAKTAVISCGTDNKYGHPHAETMTKLKTMKLTVYRTDLQGTIIATSDGKKITFKTKKSVSNTSSAGTQTTVQATKKPSSQNTSSTTYIGNKNSKKFHLPTCKSLPSAKNRVKFSSRQKAINSGYQPCKNCNP